MQCNYHRPFTQFVKKAKKPLQLSIEDAVLRICKAPELGEKKVGDLKGIFVYTFRSNNQEYLIAYRYSKDEGLIEWISMDFYLVGSHEKFYSNLKIFLRNK